MDLKDLWDQKEKKVLMYQKESLVHRDLRGHRDQMELRGLKVKLGLKDLLDLLVKKAQMGHRDHREILVHQGQGEMCKYHFQEF